MRFDRVVQVSTLAIDKEDDMVADSILVIENVASKLWVVGEDGLQRFPNCLSLDLTWWRIQVSLQIGCKNDSRHGSRLP